MTTGIARFKAKGHPQQLGTVGQLDLSGEVDAARDLTDDRATTWELFNPLHERFGFTVDACASSVNAKLPRYWTKDDDGLAQPWASERVWCNPPYSNLAGWVGKAWAEAAELVVMLVPANRTETPWWQRHIEPHRDQGGRLAVEFLPGRPRFVMPGETHVRPNMRPPFGCALLIFGQA